MSYLEAKELGEVLGLVAAYERSDEQAIADLSRAVIVAKWLRESLSGRTTYHTIAARLREI